MPHFFNTPHAFKKIGEMQSSEMQFGEMPHTPSKYVNPNFINNFVNFLIKHIFEENITNETEEFIQTINIPLLYSIFIIKSKVNPNFNISNIDDKSLRKILGDI
ncbi:hypothetical protein LY90DRAFT_668143 [Neocallimastix californiae]|uniref:Uncharacterized protein n=1 Tax=Neocallimastix californiae TaxID=1754190 RepID=A0A1Y2DZL6_9FUNG|nr:hypothetical protein LY90DRAFT_668143 [Neocallimastix californiae]|eukprot:ORY64546.1 hypothetical protein LY90DRAFT_668143 [Neocallimastix californiae]